MKLSLLTFSILKDALEKIVDADLICRIMRNAGYEEADMMEFEFRAYGRENLLKALKKYDIRLGCLTIAAPFYTAPERVEDYIKVNLGLAREAGTRLIMIIPGGGDDKAVCSKMTREEMLHLAVQHFQEACRLAKPYGIRIGFENTPQDFKPLASPEEVSYVLERVPSLGLVFDTGNFRVADTAANELAIYERLKSRIIRFHLKDVRIGSFPQGEVCRDGQVIIPVITGSGVIPIGELIRRSQADGFAGTYAMEYAAIEGTTGVAHIEAAKGYRLRVERMAEAKL